MELHSLFMDLNYWLGELHNSMLQLHKSGVLMKQHYSQLWFSINRFWQLHKSIFGAAWIYLYKANQQSIMGFHIWLKDPHNSTSLMQFNEWLLFMELHNWFIEFNNIRAGEISIYIYVLLLFINVP